MDWLGSIWTFALGLVAGYVLLAVLVTIFQRRLIYKPDPRRTTPQACGLSGVRIVELSSGDASGVQGTPVADIVAWYAPALPGYPTLLYFHGNAGYIELRADRIADLMRRGFGVLMPSYRGYAGSRGKASEARNIADARLAYDWLREQGVPAADIVLFGESLGTGIATQLAGTKVSAGLVLDSPYTSMGDLGANDFPWLPVRYLLWDRYETIHHIKRVTVPILVIHGHADQRVPFSMGESVAARAVAPVQLIGYPGAGHLDHRRMGSFDDVERWVRMLPTRQRRVPPRITAE